MRLFSSRTRYEAIFATMKIASMTSTSARLKYLGHCLLRADQNHLDGCKNTPKSVDTCSNSATVMVYSVAVFPLFTVLLLHFYVHVPLLLLWLRECKLFARTNLYMPGSNLGPLSGYSAGYTDTSVYSNEKTLLSLAYLKASRIRGSEVPLVKHWIHLSWNSNWKESNVITLQIKAGRNHLT